MKKETLQAIVNSLDTKMLTHIDVIQFGIAVKIREGVKEVIDLILDSEFEGAELMYQCENCQEMLLSNDEIHSDESGDCHFCAKCFEEAKAAGCTVELGPEDNLTEESH